MPESIKNGLFVFGSKRNYVHIKPPLHDNFARIPSSLQTLFLKAFDAGHNNPALRPKAEEWGRTIYMELKDSARQLQGFSKTIPAQPMKKASTVNVNYADTRQQQRWAAKTATTTPTPPAAKTPPAPVVTPKKSLPIGKIVRWAMALCVFFFIVLPVLRGLINFVNSRARSRSSSSNPRASSACQQGSTGYLTTNVKLRYNPGTDYKQLAVHYKGAKVQILETRQGEYSRGNNYWYRIRVLNKGCHAELPNVCGSEGSAMEGWIHSLLVTCN